MKEIQNEKIFDLLANKTFQELTKDEEQLVLKEMSKEDYDDMQSIIGEFKSVDAALDIKTTIPTFKSKAKKSTKLWNYRIPSYQVAAMILVAIVLTFGFTKSKEIQSPEFVSNEQVKDTSFFPGRSVSLENEDYPENLVISL